MTSISSLSGSTSTVSPSSVKPTDGIAFRTAINDIVSGLQSATSATATTSAATPTTSMNDKVGDLIDKEVSAGKLSTDQATELKSLFAKTAGHMHHVHGAKPTTDLASTDLTSTDDDTVDATSAASGGPSLIDDATQALGSLISGIKSATAASGLYNVGGITHGGLGSLLVHAFA